MFSQKNNVKNAQNCPQKTGLYIHIPFCRSKCRYCAFYSEPIKNHSPTRLISAIIAELTRYQPPKDFSTIYIGGGSPSCIPIKLLLKLINKLASWRGLPARENTAKMAVLPLEFTVEANPGQINIDALTRLRSAGVNRLSIGAQSFNPDELSLLGRQHSASDIGRAVKIAKQAGFENIGLDLIFAIPASTLKSLKHSLQSAIDLDVRHISAYALTYEHHTPLQKAVETGSITPVDEETDRQMYDMTIDTLENAGFKQYEISNFAKPGFECKHNLNCWANFPYLGIGPAAASYWNGKRTLNIPDIKKYIDAIENGKSATIESEALDKTQIACETAVLNLRRRCGIILDDFKKQTGFDAEKLFAEPIGKYKKLRLIHHTKHRLYLTRSALPIADSILCDFSAV
jgi:oxygen-independent coproporphyrinogen III oxidase